MSNQTLYIMTGLPYAGKTTLRKELIKRFGFNYISMDDVIDEKDFDVPKMTQDDWNYVYSEGYRKLKEALVEGKTVILDLGNLKLSERNTAKNIAKSLNIPFKLIYANTPKEEVLKRWRENQETKVRGHLEDESLKRAFDMFQEPTAVENPVIYNAQMNIENWIKDNIK